MKNTTSKNRFFRRIKWSGTLRLSALARERGQGLIEYLILVALISVATIAVVRVVGQALNSRLASVAYALQGQKRKPSVDAIEESHLKKRDLNDFMNGVGGGSGGGGAGAGGGGAIGGTGGFNGGSSAGGSAGGSSSLPGGD